MASCAEGRAPSFVSLGMVVVDELRSPGNAPLTDIPGGSGTFSTFGARLVSGEEQAADVGCFILAGNDFPDSVLARLELWGIGMTVKVDRARLSTRGLLEYHDVSFSRQYQRKHRKRTECLTDAVSGKTFRYTTTPLQPTPKDLPLPLLRASAFHLLAGPADAEKQVEELSRLRSQLQSPEIPLLVWEPLPIQVSAAAKDAHLAACKHVDVFSPNHLELMTLFQGPVSEEEADDAAFRKDVIEAYADAVLDAGIGPDGKGTIVVRAGSRGCLVASSQIRGAGRHRWLPAFSFDHSSERSVVDATGAGNTFLGALTFAMASRGYEVLEAAKRATVAASFALEQIGLATLDKTADGQEERWNGETFGQRYRTYESKILSRS